MKKIFFFGLMALTGLFTACSQDDTCAPAADSNQVSMSIEMPADFAKTRAVPSAPDGHQLRCILEVWDEQRTTLKVRKEQLAMGTANMTFSFELTEQGKYTAVLWADYIDATTNTTTPVTIGRLSGINHYADKYYKTDNNNGPAFGLQLVEIIESAYTTNPEVRDAFTAVVPFTKGIEAKNDLTATLVRPLTKVTIAEKNAAMFNRCQTMTATYSVPLYFNALLEMTTYNNSSNKEFGTITYNAAPTGGDISISQSNCKILFTDYIFTGEESTMGEIALTFVPGSGTLNARTIGANLPLKRNNWIRAAGNLITSDDIDPNVSMIVDMNTTWEEQDRPDIPERRIGDYYYKDGTSSHEYTQSNENPVIGIVYEVNADGTGHVVSLNGFSGAWTTAGNYAVTGATSMTDGKDNTAKVFAYIESNGIDIANYPIFQACQQLRTETGKEGWYIPVNYRILSLTDAINDKFSAAGGTPIEFPASGYENHYWTSYESNENQAMTRSNEFNGISNAKSTSLKVRFVLDF